MVIDLSGFLVESIGPRLCRVNYVVQANVGAQASVVVKSAATRKRYALLDALRRVAEDEAGNERGP